MPQITTNAELRERNKAMRSIRARMSEGDGAGRDAIGWGTLLRVAAPWLITVGVVAGGPLLRYVAVARDVAGFVALLIGLSGFFILWASLQLIMRRSGLARLHEVFNIVAPTGVLVYTVGWGVNLHVELGAFAAGVTSAIIWHRRHVNSSDRMADTQHAGGAGGLNASWRRFVGEHAPALLDSTATVVRDEADELAFGLDLGNGSVPKDLDNLGDRIIRWAGGVKGGVTFTVGEKLDQVLVRVVRRDILKKPIPWQGPSAPGESIIEPMTGMLTHQDLTDLPVTLPWVHEGGLGGNDKPVSHIGLIGMSRTGKGEAGELLDLNVMLRRDAVVIVCDAVKADQQLGEIAEGAAYVLDNINAIRSFLSRLVRQTIPARGAYLGDPTRNQLGKVCKEWEPGCGLTWVTVHLYEGAALYGMGDLVKLGEQAAGVGIDLLFEAQKAMHDRVDTNLRSSLGAAFVFGTFDDNDASLILPSEHLDAGAAPWVWKNTRGGMCYPLLPTLPLHRQVMPARWHRKGAGDISDALAEYGHLGGTLDPVTAATFGEPYERFVAERQARRAGRPVQHFTGAGSTLLRPQAATTTAPVDAPVDAPGPAFARHPYAADARGAVLIGEPSATPVVLHPATDPSAAPATTTAPDPFPGGVVSAEVLPPAARVHSAPAGPEPETGFDLSPDADEDDGEDDGEDGDGMPDAFTRQQLDAEAGADVLDAVPSLVADEFDDGDPDRAAVMASLAETVDAPDPLADPPDEDYQPRNMDAVDAHFVLPEDPDEAHFRAPVDRYEAFDILLDILRNDIREGNTFTPGALYAEVDRRAVRSDSWVRRALTVLVEWGCIEATERRGAYLVVRCDRPEEIDEDDYAG